MSNGDAVGDRIAIDPEIMGGKPVVRGTRIPVDLVVRFLSVKSDQDELFRAYPHLTPDDVKACLDYDRRRSQPD